MIITESYLKANNIDVNEAWQCPPAIVICSYYQRDIIAANLGNITLKCSLIRRVLSSCLSFLGDTGSFNDVRTKWKWHFNLSLFDIDLFILTVLIWVSWSASALKIIVCTRNLPVVCLVPGSVAQYSMFYGDFTSSWLEIVLITIPLLIPVQIYLMPFFF